MIMRLFASLGFAGALAAALSVHAAEPAANELTIEINHLRNGKGMIHACLTRDHDHFPDCAADTDALRLSVRTRDAGALRFRGVPGGTYALSIIHDENGNGKLDTFAKIPREGYGFSGNPPVRFGPPKFEEARFELTPGPNRQQVRVRYLL
ncbi:DUF2141 domain-containing protein [Pelagerythrobacter marensis]|uniref:DUF2141 domain-containing protein n=1 Tax=Pelagerythrobacter marensis TaxID=543877 RepID=A0A0G3X6Y1_9SPHN|nr:DUF2141 domain-containing protein [Pelagerythrobacter marensis]AKM07310.1 hypothetical protein AM2010_1236 [Pelagerythrobacter marensis]